MYLSVTYTQPMSSEIIYCHASPLCHMPSVNRQSSGSASFVAVVPFELVLPKLFHLSWGDLSCAWVLPWFVPVSELPSPALQFRLIPVKYAQPKGLHYPDWLCRMNFLRQAVLVKFCECTWKRRFVRNFPAFFPSAYPPQLRIDLQTVQQHDRGR